MTFQELFQKVLEADIDLDTEIYIAQQLPFPNYEDIVECSISSEDKEIILYY